MDGKTTEISRTAPEGAVEAFNEIPWSTMRLASVTVDRSAAGTSVTLAAAVPLTDEQGPCPTAEIVLHDCPVVRCDLLAAQDPNALPEAFYEGKAYADGPLVRAVLHQRPECEERELAEVHLDLEASHSRIEAVIRGFTFRFLPE